MATIDEIHNIEFDVEVRPPDAGPIQAALTTIGAALDQTTVALDTYSQAYMGATQAMARASVSGPVEAGYNALGSAAAKAAGAADTLRQAISGLGDVITRAVSAGAPTEELGNIAAAAEQAKGSLITFRQEASEAGNVLGRTSSGTSPTEATFAGIDASARRAATALDTYRRADVASADSINRGLAGGAQTETSYGNIEIAAGKAASAVDEFRQANAAATQSVTQPGSGGQFESTLVAVAAGADKAKTSLTTMGQASVSVFEVIDRPGAGSQVIGSLGGVAEAADQARDSLFAVGEAAPSAFQSINRANTGTAAAGLNEVANAATKATGSLTIVQRVGEATNETFTRVSAGTQAQTVLGNVAAAADKATISLSTVQEAGAEAFGSIAHSGAGAQAEANLSGVATAATHTTGALAELRSAGTETIETIGRIGAGQATVTLGAVASAAADTKKELVGVGQASGSAFEAINQANTGGRFEASLEGVAEAANKASAAVAATGETFVATLETINRPATGTQAEAALGSVANASVKAADALTTVRQESATTFQSLGRSGSEQQAEASLGGITIAAGKAAESLVTLNAANASTFESLARASTGQETEASLGNIVVAADKAKTSLSGVAQANAQASESISRSSGSSQITATLDAAASSSDKLRQAQIALADAVDKTNKQASVSDAEWRRIATSLDPYQVALTRALNRQEQLNRLIGEGRGDVEQYGRLLLIAAGNVEQAQRKLDGFRVSLDQANASIGKAAPEQQTIYSKYLSSAEQPAVAAVRAAQYQQSINQSIGIQLPSSENTTARAADMKALGDAILETRGKYDSLIKVSKEYSDTITGIQADERSGAITAEQSAIAQERVTKAFSDANQPMRNIESALEASQQKFRSLQSSLDPLGAALERAKAELADLNVQIAAAGPSQQKYTELLPAAEQRVAQLTRQHDQFLTSINKVDPLTKNAAQGIRFMSTQWIDVVQQLASGQNPIQVILQQGGQILQIAAMTDVSFKKIGIAIAGWAASATGLTTIIGGSLVAALGAFALVTEKHNRALLESQRTISLTHESYAQLGADAEMAAKAIARTTSASVSDARATTTAIAASANWAGTAQQLQRVGTVAVELDQRLGKAGEGAKLLSDALENPAKVAEDLATKHFPGFNQELARTIERMQNSGEKGTAFGRVLALLQGEADKTAGKFKTPLQEALEALGKSFTNLGDSVKGLSETVGTFVIDKLADGIKTLTGYIESIKQLFESIKQIYQQIIDLYNRLPIPKGFPSLGETLRNSLPTTNFLPSNPLSSLFTPSASDYQRQIRDAADQRNFTAENTDLALSIARQESGFQQFNRFGGVTTSSAGAQGIFQLMPGTASDLHKNPADAQQNIEGGLDYIAQLIKDPAFGGDPALVAMAYNWGPGNAKAFLAGTKTLGDVPQETKNYVRGVTGKSVGDIQVSPRSIIDISGGGSDRTGGANQRIDIDALVKDARGSGINREGIENAADAVQRYSAGLKQLREDGITSGKSVEILNQALQHATDNYNHLLNPLLKDTEALQDETKVTREVGKANQDLIAIRNAAARARQTGNGPSAAQEEAQVAALTERQTAAFAAQTDELNINIEATNKQAAAWTDGAAAAALATANATAHKQVLDTLASSTHDTAKAEAERTQKILESAAAQERLKAGQELNQLGDQISLIRLEDETLGKDNDTRALAIQHLRDEQAVRRDYAASLALGDTALAQSVLNQRDAVAKMESNLRARTRDFDEISGAIGSAFDNIGNSIAQAFIQGEGSAVNFLNVMKSIAASIIQEFIKLAAINPLRNILFGGEGGQTLPTITSVFNSIGQSSISSGQIGFFGQGIFGTSQQEARLNAYNAEFANPLGASSSDINAGNFGPGSGILPSNTPAATGLFGGAGLGATAGSFIGGFGLGAGAGNIVQSAVGKTGPAPMIGAAIGAGIGAIFGPVGALVGGLIGGAAGGLIGPKPASPYAATFVGVDASGKLNVSPTLQGNQITASNYADIQNQTKQFNQQQAALGVKIIGVGSAPPAGDASGLGFFGTAKNPQGFAGQNVTDAFTRLRFGADTNVVPEKTTDVLNRYINTKVFESFNDLGQSVNKVRTFVEQTVPALEKMANSTGNLGAAIQNIHDQFDPAIKTAQELGYAEDILNKARDKALADATEQAYAAIRKDNVNYALRAAQAQASLSGNAQDQFNYTIQALDASQADERATKLKQLLDTFGEPTTLEDQQRNADQIASLERTLGLERLAIIKQANAAILQQEQQAKEQREAQMEQARGTGAQLITSIRDYAHGLQYSQQSPLSPQAMFAQAQRDFQAVSGAAVAGDANSLAQVTSRSDTYLQAARSLYGSGQGYANVFKQVTDTLARIGEVNPDTLTASVFALETRTQTTALTTALAELKAELAGIRAQLASGSAMPARLAA